MTSHLNFNSLGNKIVAVEELMQNKVKVCLFSETKLDERSPKQNFKIHDYKLYRRDKGKHDGGVILIYQWTYSL